MEEEVDTEKAAEAEALLEHLLGAVARTLSRMEQPAMVMFCPNRMGPGYREPADWFAVQIGQATWEQSIWWEGGRNPEDTQAAREILPWLHPAWSELAEQAFGLKSRKRFVAMYSQHAAQWFVFDHGENSVFLIQPSGGMEFVGEACDNLDNRLGEDAPLLLKRVYPAAWTLLHAAVPELSKTHSLIRNRE